MSRATAAEGVLTTDLAAEVSRAEGIEAGLIVDITELNRAATYLVGDGGAIAVTTDLGAEYVFPVSALYPPTL